MLLATLSAQTVIPRIYPTAYPYVWSIALVFNTTSVYWTTVFGAPAESQASVVNMLGLTLNDLIYTEFNNLADVEATEGSWYFDAGAQVLWIHVDHDTDAMVARVSYGKALGFADKDFVNINGFEYLPMVRSVPKLSQVQDLVAYDKLAELNGELVLSNVGGLLDYLVQENLIGGDATLSYLPDDQIDSLTGDASAGAVVPLAAFYVEDFAMGYQEFRIALQDKRKSQDSPFPTTRFAVADYPNLDDSTLDLPVPVVYGYQRELKALPTNGKAASTTVRYRAGLLLTVLTTVYLKILDKWTASTPSSINLATGEFDVAGAKANNTAAPYECKVEATGIAVVYASDVITDLNLRYAGVPFTDGFYDTAEWTAEQASLLTIGVVFDAVTTIFEAVRHLQAGANVGFRYEINASGKRTIRIDNTARTPLQGADNVEILDPNSLLPETDTQFLAATVRIGYQLSNQSGRYLTVADATYAASVLTNYRIRAEERFDTLLTSLTHATARAALDAVKFSTPFTQVSCVVRGERYLSLRLLDILPVAITADGIDLDTGILDDVDGRAFFGVQLCKVVGIDPDYQLVQNNVRLQLLSPVSGDPVRSLVYTDGVTRIISASGSILVSVGG